MVSKWSDGHRIGHLLGECIDPRVVQKLTAHSVEAQSRPRKSLGGFVCEIFAFFLLGPPPYMATQGVRRT